MTLAPKTITLFLVLGFALVSGCYVALETAVYPKFEEFELEQAETNLSRARELLAAEWAALGTFGSEYGEWSETYRYALGENPGFPEENLDSAYFHESNVDIVVLFNAALDPVYELVTSPEVRALLAAEPGLRARIIEQERAPSRGDLDTDSRTVLDGATDPLLLVSKPILKSDGSGPASGRILLGRFLTADRIQGAARRGSIDLTVESASELSASPEKRAILRRLQDPGVSTLSEASDSSTTAYELLRDASRNPAAVLTVTTPRTISAMGTRTVRTALTVFAGASVAFLLAAWMFMQRLIVRPIRSLTDRVASIRDSSDLEFEIAEGRRDEVGMLAAEFRGLSSRLRRAQVEVEDARDRALAMSRAKSEFLARMSHEIRTPMNGVLGMTELLRDTRLDRTQRRFVQTINDSAVSLLHIINDILDFSKMEAGGLKLDRCDFDLRALLEQTVESLAGQAHAKGLELVNDMPFDLDSKVNGDPVRLRQILTNLIGNAVKFTEEGEIAVRTTLERESDDRCTIAFAVSDTGIGIAPDNHALIFESFAQEDGSTTRLYGGTGLGLAISKQLVEMMGGELSVESRPGRGSTFSFSLSMAVGGSLTRELPQTGGGIAGQRVLVVDDNKTNREILDAQLSKWSIEPRCVSSASEALAALDEAEKAGRPYALAILDVHMPKTDGIELAEMIRDRRATSAIKLMLLSSVMAPASEEVLEKLDIECQLMKPIRQSDLFDAMMAVLTEFRERQTTDEDSAAAAPRFRNARILLVEDNPVNQAVAREMLTALGLEVASAANGSEAVESFEQDEHDLILMDCQMPTMDGFQATRAIRRRESELDRRRTPIVALTANALEGDRERCLAAGMDDYLSKPFTSDSLRTMLRRYLGDERGRSAGDSRDPASETKAGLRPAESVIDRRVLGQLAGLGKSSGGNVVARIIEVYLQSASELKESLCAALNAGDWQAVALAAHTLKSSSANVGANGLADLCRRLEELARNGGAESGAEHVRRVEREYGQVHAELSLELEQLTESAA